MKVDDLVRRARVLSAAIVLVGAALTVSAAAISDAGPSPAEIVARTVHAHGGGIPLNTLKTLAIEVDGHVAAPFQSYRATPPFDELPLRIRYALDFAGKRAAQDYFSEFPGGYRLDSRSIAGPRATEVDHRSRTYSMPETIALAPYRYSTLAALEQFAAAGSTWQLKGTTALDGRRVYEVSAESRGKRAGLLIDAEDWMLRGLTLPRPHPLDPQGVMTVHYRDFERVSGWLSATRVSGRYLEQPKAGFDVNVRITTFNSPLSDAAFTVPAGYTAVDPVPTSGPHVRELAAGVHLIERLLGDEYNALLVEFSDHLLLVEAPLDEAAGAQLRNVIARIGNGKPLRHLVLTHPHEDHIGGLRGVLNPEWQPNIISTAESEDLVRAMAGATIAFEAVSVSRPRTISDGKRRVQIINLGPNPHTAELLVVYLPEERILFQADMLTVAHDQVASPPGNPGTAFLDAAIDRLGLDVAYVAGAHGVLGTRYDLRRAARDADEISALLLPPDTHLIASRTARFSLPRPAYGQSSSVQRRGMPAALTMGFDTSDSLVKGPATERSADRNLGSERARRSTSGAQPR